MDADPQGSASWWAGRGEMPFDLAQEADPALLLRLRRVRGYGAVVVDTPPPSAPRPWRRCSGRRTTPSSPRPRPAGPRGPGGDGAAGRPPPRGGPPGPPHPGGPRSLGRPSRPRPPSWRPGCPPSTPSCGPTGAHERGRPGRQAHHPLARPQRPGGGGGLPPGGGGAPQGARPDPGEEGGVRRRRWRSW